jgi:hypothetical protein
LACLVNIRPGSIINVDEVAAGFADRHSPSWATVLLLSGLVNPHYNTSFKQIELKIYPVSPVSLQLYARRLHIKTTSSSLQQRHSGHRRLQPRPFISAPAGAHHYSADTPSTTTKDKMSCISLILTPELLLSVREFWFEHLSGPDSLVMPTTDENNRWFFGGSEFDRLCV